MALKREMSVFFDSAYTCIENSPVSQTLAPQIQALLNDIGMPYNKSSPGEARTHLLFVNLVSTVPRILRLFFKALKDSF